MKKLTPNVMVENVNSTTQFYRDVLGFALLATVPEEGQFDWAMMKHGGVEIMFQTRASLAGELPMFQKREIPGSLTFYIEVEDIKELYANLKERVTIVHDMRTTFYNTQEFSIQDNDGNILTFAESA